MHVAFLTPEYPSPAQPEGGLANYLKKVAWSLSARGHRITVVVSSDEEHLSAEDAISVHRVARPWYGRALERALPAFGRFASALRVRQEIWRIQVSHPIDIVQAASYGGVGYGLRSNGRVPFVCRISSYGPLLRAQGGHPKLSNWLDDRMELRQIMDADAAFSPSVFLADVYERTTGVRPTVIRTPLETIPTGWDESVYNARFAGTRYLLYFGTLNRVKGADLVGDALPGVLARHPNLRFAFVGRDEGLPGERRAMDYVLRRCSEFSSRILYEAPLPRASLMPIVANAVGVVIPSRADNYPNACLEAMTAGVPVVGTSGSSLDEMVEDGLTGFLAAAGDVESLRCALERLLALDASELDGMRCRVFRQARLFAAEDRIGELLRFYADVVCRFQQGRRRS
jgi:glycogen(starch) synthase